MHAHSGASSQVQALIFTGKGGVGKTTCAAATALHLARLDVPTLVVSTDPAHSLGDCFQQKLEKAPTLILPNLWGMELDALNEMRVKFDDIREVLVKQMQKHGLDEFLAEEVVFFPGADELFGLLKIAELKRSSRFRAIVVDTAPTGNTMRFLHFPEFLAPVRRALKVDRVYSHAVRPLASLLNRNIPTDDFYSSVFSLFDEIETARYEILEGKTYFRFVLNPEKLAVLETQRAVSFLNISGHTVDALLINKILPDSVTDPFFRAWKRNQQQYIEETKESFYPLSVLEVPLYEREVLGIDMLEALAQELYKEHNPLDQLTTQNMVEINRNGPEVELRVQIPYEEHDELKLSKQGQELMVSVGPYDRKVQLPAILLPMEVKHARKTDNFLAITFG